MEVCEVKEREQEIIKAVKAQDMAVLTSMSKEESLALIRFMWNGLKKLHEANQKLEAELAQKHAGGRKAQYTQTERAKVVAFYNQEGETYKSTSARFDMSTDTVKRIVQQLQTMFNYIVIDTSSMFSVLNLSMLDISTVVVFLGIVDFLPTIKNMKSGIDTLKKLNYDRNKLRIVLNRSNARTRIPMDEVTGILGETFYHILPNDFQAANASIKSGVPLVLSQGGDGLGLALRELVRRSTNQHYEEEPADGNEKNSGGLFHRLFGKG